MWGGPEIIPNFRPVTSASQRVLSVTYQDDVLEGGRSWSAPYGVLPSSWTILRQGELLPTQEKSFHTVRFVRFDLNIELSS